MANLDTVAKRNSGINVSCPWRGLLPIPDGVISQTDRQAVVFMYSGISAGVYVPPATVGAKLPKIYPIDLLRPLSGARPA